VIRSLPRRTFLRGLGGVAIALPTLEIMLDPHGESFAGGGTLPRRFLVAFDGQSLGADGDGEHNRYVPTTIGADYELREATMALGDYGGVKDEVTIVSGLRIPYNTGNGIPAGGWDLAFHEEARRPLLCGVRNTESGPSSDQIVAAAIGTDTRFASLQYIVQASPYMTASQPYGRDVLSYTGAFGNATEMVPEASPRAAWQSLFTGFVPTDPGDAAAAAALLARRKSVIDLVGGRIERLLGDLGAVDRQRMERHLDEIRALEQLLDEVPDVTATCEMLPDPGQDPHVGAAQPSAGGDDYDTNESWSDETARGRVFADLIHMAFVCDLTRSVSLMYTMFQSYLNSFPVTGSPYDTHELGHSGAGTGTMSRMIAWHVDQFANLVAKLRDAPEGSGSVLDNAVLVLVHEGGHGYDPGAGADNSAHSTENMACMIAGRAGGLQAGRHVVATGMHPGNVLVSAMQAVGVESDLGQVSGAIPELFA
jgi:hypothetical protein